MGIATPFKVSETLYKTPAAGRLRHFWVAARMPPASVLDRFVEKCPAAVVVRATLENLLAPGRIDQIFHDVRERPCEGTLLFSQLVAVMAAVATREHASVHAAYLDAKDELGVSAAARYDKLNRLEPSCRRRCTPRTARRRSPPSFPSTIWFGAWSRCKRGWRSPSRPKPGSVASA